MVVNEQRQEQEVKNYLKKYYCINRAKRLEYQKQYNKKNAQRYKEYQSNYYYTVKKARSNTQKKRIQAVETQHDTIEQHLNSINDKLIVFFN